MKKFYQTVTMKIGSDDEWVEYEGEYLDEAVKKRDTENYNHCDPQYYTEVRVYNGETLDDAILFGYDVLFETENVEILVNRNKDIIEYANRVHNTKLVGDNCGFAYYAGCLISDAPEIYRRDKEHVLSLCYGLDPNKDYTVSEAHIEVRHNQEVVGTIVIYIVEIVIKDEDGDIVGYDVRYFAPSNFRVR